MSNARFGLVTVILTGTRAAAASSLESAAHQAIVSKNSVIPPQSDGAHAYAQKRPSQGTGMI
jgi:hypothetical protein